MRTSKKYSFLLGSRDNPNEFLVGRKKGDNRRGWLGRLYLSWTNERLSSPERIENSYERSNETGEPTRLVLERGHKRRTVLSLPRAPVIRGPALQLSPCHREIDEVNLVLLRWDRMYRLNRFESGSKSFFNIPSNTSKEKKEIISE